MTEVGRAQFKVDTATLYPDNTSGEISPADLRAQMTNIADSAVFKGSAKTSAPTANDDASGTGGNGTFNEGDIWIDETNDNAYICLDDTATAAVWGLIGGDLIVTRSGIAASNQVATWASASEIQGDGSLTWNSNNRLAIVANAPIIEWDDNDAAADNQRWQAWSDAGTFKIQALTDAGAAGGSLLELTRTGNLVTALQLTQSGAARTIISQNAINFGLATSTIGTLGAFDLSLRTDGVNRLIVGAAGNVTIAGDGASTRTFNVGDSTQTTGSVGIQIGNARTGDGPAFIDLVTDAATYTDYGFRFTRAAGANGSSQLIHRGSGIWRFRAEDTASLRFETNGANVLLMEPTFESTFFGDVTLSKLSPTFTLNDTVNLIDASFQTINPGTPVAIFGTDSTHGLRFKTDGVSRMYIDAVGQIGIGTNFPLGLLTLNGETPDLIFNDVSSTNRGSIDVDDSVMNLRIDDANGVGASGFVYYIDNAAVAVLSAATGLTVDGPINGLQTQVEVTGTFRRVRPTESGYSYEMTSGSANTIEIIGFRDFTITGATQANPVVITIPDTTQLETGDQVEISGVVGMTELNGNTYTITVINGTTVSLDGIDGTGFTAYVSGGTARRQPLVYPVGFWFEVIQMGAGVTSLAASELIPLNGATAIPGGVSGDITNLFGVIRVRLTESFGWVVNGDIGVIS